MWILISGIVLTGVSWFIAWSRIAVLTDYSFFPLWLGYILVVNGVCEVLWHDSLLSRMGGSFAWLFVLSVPMWWLFEYMNSIVNNWNYVFAHPISQLHFVIQASVDFATVVPAALSTSFLFYRHFRRKGYWPYAPWQPNVPALVIGVLLSGMCFGLICLFPRQAFPLIWIAPILLLEPVAYWAGRSSLVSEVASANWALPFSTMLATVFTGFFWELWNFNSLPKWVYTIPYVGFWKVFEMPILGFLGYLPFGLIVYSYTALTLPLLTGKSLHSLFVAERRSPLRAAVSG